MQKFAVVVRANRFPLAVAAAWLVLVWSLVIAGNLLYGEPISLGRWAGSWDGAWYKSIVEQGYYRGVIDHQANVAFFPLFPLLAWLVSKLTLLPTVWAGMAVSSLGFAGALVVLWRFANTFFTRAIARWTLLLLAFNPWSLYFGMMYTESLFLLLAAGTLWFLYKKQWWWASALAGLATATRSVGVALTICVIVGWLWNILARARKNRVAPSGVASKKIFAVSRQNCIVCIVKTLGLTIVSCSGILLYSLFLWQHTGDAAAYRTAQTYWPGRGGFTNIGNELLYLWEHKSVTMEYLLTSMWYVAGAIAFVGLVLVLRMRQWLLALYTGIALSLPILFGTATSMNRYMQVTFPIFIAYASVLQAVPQWARWALLAVCVAGLGVITILTVDPREFFMA